MAFEVAVALLVVATVVLSILAGVYDLGRERGYLDGWVDGFRKGAQK